MKCDFGFIKLGCPKLLIATFEIVFTRVGVLIVILSFQNVFQPVTHDFLKVLKNKYCIIERISKFKYL